MWTFNERVKQQLADYKQKYPGVTFREIKSDAQLNDFLQDAYK
jgi:hypothetical protein